MMGIAKRKAVVAVAAALTLATAGAGARGLQQAAPGGSQDPNANVPLPSTGTGGSAIPSVATDQALAKEQVALADKALGTLHEMARNGRMSLADPALALWNRRKLDALRRTGAGKDAMIAALEHYIGVLKLDESTSKDQLKNAKATQIEVDDVRFRLLEAEIWLNEEKTR